ncbi:MAG TPA: hypothetical protein VKF62_08145 [Planctomycetota bacterium]|nr:hypothetical protein [Planctomycetota bacterium]
MSKPAEAARCASCGSPLESLGQIPVRIGGVAGKWVWWFGALAQTEEKVAPLDAYRCSRCTRLEFFDHDRSLPRG